jgi:hypothetical protein
MSTNAADTAPRSTREDTCNDMMLMLVKQALELRAVSDAQTMEALLDLKKKQREWQEKASAELAELRARIAKLERPPSPLRPFGSGGSIFTSTPQTAPPQPYWNLGTPCSAANNGAMSNV